MHDSLLTLYHGVRLHHRSTASCQWAGNDYILPTLREVIIVIVIIFLLLKDKKI